MIIKICGITNYEDALVCAKLNIDFIGFNFYKKSQRFIEPKIAKSIIKRLKEFEIKSVGIFVNEDISELNEIVNLCCLDVVQLHGDENYLYVKNLKNILKIDIKFIKAFRVKNKVSLKKIDKFNVDYFLFDSFEKNNFGGTGKTFDYSLLENIKRDFFIAGGLSIINIKKAIEISPFGFDINSKIESSPGKKDHKKLKKIIEVIRNET